MRRADRDSGAGAGRHTPTALYLTVNSSEVEKAAEYAKDDIWVVCTAAAMPTGPRTQTRHTQQQQQQHWSSSGKRSRGSADRFTSTAAAAGDGVGEGDGEGWGDQEAGALSHACLFKSAFHGPSSRGMIELQPLLPWEKYV